MRVPRSGIEQHCEGQMRELREAESSSTAKGECECPRSGIEQHCEGQMRELREAESSSTHIAKRNLQENQEGQRICR